MPASASALRFFGSSLERAQDQLLRLALQALAARHGERVGEVDEQLRVARRAHRRLGVGVDRLREAPEHGVGAAEHLPAVDVVRVLAQPRREPLHHGLDLLRRERGGCAEGSTARGLPTAK